MSAGIELLQASHSTTTTRPFTLIGVPLALSIAIASIAGVGGASLYDRESASYAAQAIGQDWVDLLFLAPLILFSALSSQRGSRAGRLIFGGALMYSFYNFAIYAFAVHFNELFLVYCGALGLSSFALAALGADLLRERPTEWFEPQLSLKPAAAVQLGIALVFASLWLADVVPAIVTDTTPKAVEENAFFTNPVHVLDLSLVLPGLVLSAVLLLKKRALGYLLTPMFLVLAVLMSIGIAGMVIAAWAQGVAIDTFLAALFAGVAAVCGAVLLKFLRGLRRIEACCS